MIELFPDKAPKHVERIKELAVWQIRRCCLSRVIEGFMAQTGDIQYGKKGDFNSGRVGTGSSDLADLDEEFNDTKHVRGTCSMARSSSPNSANSQFFICFEPAPFLDRQYTVWGQVIDGMEFVDNIKLGKYKFRAGLDFMIKVSAGSSKPSKKAKPSKK